jgi:DNA-binding LytR/AlgR family response regulator
MCIATSFFFPIPTIYESLDLGYNQHRLLKNTCEKARGDMIKIAIVEDELTYRKQLNTYIRQYEAEKGEEFQIVNFSDGLDIVENYSASYDIIFMDIEMKHMNGMAAAQRIREQDKEVVLIFITNLAQFAIQGYQVEALDYVLKPINAFAFAQELQKAVKKVREKKSFFLHIIREGNMFRLDSAKITYIESQGHNVVFHTRDEDYIGRDSLRNLEKKLEGHHFSRCNSCYLVNLAYVTQVDKNVVFVGGTELQISRPKKKPFMEDLAKFVGGEG